MTLHGTERTPIEAIGGQLALKATPILRGGGLRFPQAPNARIRG
jgi:hypothetical protein